MHLCAKIERGNGTKSHHSIQSSSADVHNMRKICFFNIVILTFDIGIWNIFIKIIYNLFHLLNYTCELHLRIPCITMRTRRTIRCMPVCKCHYMHFCDIFQRCCLWWVLSQCWRSDKRWQNAGAHIDKPSQTSIYVRWDVSTGLRSLNQGWTD